MPVKAKAKAKRKREIAELFDPKAQKVAERRIKEVFNELDDRTDERYAYAQKILAVNSDDVADAVEKIVKTMKGMANPPRLVVDGVPVNYDEEILARIQNKIHTWAAVRLLVACAEWDIRIADFKLPKHECARCGKRVKK